MPAVVERERDVAETILNLERASVLQLPELVEQLPPPEREIFNRIYACQYSEDALYYSSEKARSHVAKRFRSEQGIDKRVSLEVSNRVFNEATLFSPIRAMRPIQRGESNQVADLLQKNSPDTCDLCHWNEQTPEDELGRVESKYCVTIANAGAYVGHHSLVIPKDIHSPLDLNEVVVTDMIHSANTWFILKNQIHPQARFPSIGANLFPRAGGSLIHPHFQLVLREDYPSQKVEDKRRRMADYQFFNGSAYFADLARCLKPLGLVKQVGDAHIIMDPTPLKECGIIIYSPDKSGLPNGDLSRALYKVIDWWKNELHITSLNCGFYLPPLGENLCDGDWCNFFPYIRMIDRGSEDAKTSDFACMEIFDSPVVASCPFALSRSFDKYFGSSKIQ